MAGTGSEGSPGNKNGPKRGRAGSEGSPGNKNGPKRGRAGSEGSEGWAGNKYSPKRGRDGAGRLGREQKQPEMWPGPGRKAGPGTKTVLNVAGTMSEKRASDIL